MKENLIKLYKKYSHFKLFLLFIPTSVAFFWLQSYTVVKYNMHMKLDDYIPFVSAFIIPYVYWYGYCLWGYIFFAFYSKEEFVKFIKFIIYGATAACIIYFLFPNGQDLRTPIENDHIFNIIINNIRAKDPPANVFPSLHVYNSFAVNIAICESSAFKVKKWRWVRWVGYISTVLISMSTVFIKQHSIADVYGSIVMSAIFYVLIYKPSFAWLGFKKKDTFTESVPSIAVTSEEEESM